MVVLNAEEGDLSSIGEMSNVSVSLLFDSGIEYRIYSPHVFFDIDTIAAKEYQTPLFMNLLAQVIASIRSDPGTREMEVVEANFRSLVYFGNGSKNVCVEYMKR